MTEKKPSAKTEAVAKAATQGTSVAVSEKLAAIEHRLDTIESALRLELGVDPAEHAAAQERSPGGVAGDAGYNA